MWLYLEQSVFDHPKTDRLAKLLGVSIAAAAGHLGGLWSAAVDCTPDGDLTDMDAGLIARWAHWEGEPARLVRALEECRVRAGGAGYLERSGGRLLIHEFAAHEGRVLQQRAQARERVAKSRATAAQLAFETTGAPLPLARTRPRAEQTPHITRYVERKSGENKGAALIEMLREAGVDPKLTPADFKAVKDTELTVAQIADVYLAIYTGGFGTQWMQQNLTVRLAIDRWNGFQASLQPHPAPNGNGGNGRTGHIAPAVATQLWRSPEERAALNAANHTTIRRVS